MPAVGLVAFQHVLGEGHARIPVNGDVVVVVEGDQLAQLQMPRQGTGLRGHPLLVAAVPHDHVGVVIHDGAVRSIESGGQVGLRNGQTHGIGHPGSQRTCGHLHTGGFKGFRMPRGFRAPLTELLDVLQGHAVIARQVQQGIEQHAAMPGGQHKAIPVEPLGILGIVAHHLVPQGIAHGRGPHGQAGVAAFGLVDRIDGQKANAVDAEGVNGNRRGNHGAGRGEWCGRDDGEPRLEINSSAGTPGIRCARQSRRNWTGQR